MLIAIVAIAGLLSFGSANVVNRTAANPNQVQEERVISHTVGSVETVKQDVRSEAALSTTPAIPLP
jgi:hypothetical protein